MEAHVTCPVCAGTDVAQVAQFPAVPVLCNQLHDSADAARAAKCGDISLAICKRCAMIWNVAFDPALMEYGSGYDSALHFSPGFRAYVDDLVVDLTARYDLAGGAMFEIGCGDGDMLRRFVDHGAARATGIDPSMEGRAAAANSDALEIVPEPFDARHMTSDADLIVCRHVLEHIEAPGPFLSSIAEAVSGRDVALYFEVPNAQWMLSAPSQWDVIYEHVGYWTAPALETLFVSAGFEVIRVGPSYGDQFLQIEARPAQTRAIPETRAARDIIDLADSFAKTAKQQMERWPELLAAYSESVIIWGAGSKGTTFANVLTGLGQPIDALVEFNPRKHGRFIPGAAVPVVAPSDLPELGPMLVLIANGFYETEITEEVRSLGLLPDFEVIT